MPVVATGPQQVPIAVMMPALMDAAWNQLAAGLPLEVVKIVVFDESKLREAKRFLFGRDIGFRPAQCSVGEAVRIQPDPNCETKMLAMYS
jgi:hypothetical protein